MKYKIGDVERILGIPAETLRYFEKKGLITPSKNEVNNYRYYDTLDLNKLVAYKAYRGMEFPMDESLKIINSLSHAEVTGSINSQIELIHKKINYYQSLLVRLEELKHSYEQVEASEDKFCLTDSPEVLLFYNQVNDTFSTEEEQMEMTHIWLKQLPFICLALHIPKDELPLGSIVHYGYAISTHYEEIIVQLNTPGVQKIPSQKSVYTIIACESLTPDSFKEALDYMRKNDLVLNGDIIGWIINEECTASEVIRYFEVWLPIAEKSKE